MTLSLNLKRGVVLASVVAATAALSACGGGDTSPALAVTPAQTGSAPTAGTVPATATSSTSALVAYIKTLFGAESTALPLSVDGVKLPTDDAAQPSPAS